MPVEEPMPVAIEADPIRRFHKRPIEIEAMGPLTDENMDAIAVWCGGTSRSGPTGPRVTFKALGEGLVTAIFGDYVIDTTSGFDVCPPYIFTNTYDEIPHRAP